MNFDNAPAILTTEGRSLTFSDPKLQGRFELGASSAIFLWEELRTAVDSNWGGPESAEKREWLVGAVIDLFEANSVAVEDIEYRLLAALEDEFEVTLETDSAYNVAQQVMAVYQDASEQRSDRIDALYQRFVETQGKTYAHVHIEDDGEEDEEDDEEEGDENDQDQANGMQVEEANNGPIIDEDGFELVQRRRR